MRERRIGLAEAAAHLKIPYQNAHRLLLTGVLRGEKIGSRWFVDTDDVEDLLQQRVASGAESHDDPSRQV